MTPFPRLPRRTLPLAVLSLTASLTAQADVSVSRGATAIPGGEADHVQDITVANDRLAFALAVESRPPWGVPRGTLVDLAAVRDGELAVDHVAFADFIPNNWSAWPNDEKTVEIVEDSPQRAVVRISRNFDQALVTTTYTLEAGSDAVHLETVLDNRSEKPLKALRSGFTLWPDSGYLFGVPGINDAEETVADDALSDRMVAYDRDWAFALHAPYFDRINYGGQDMYLEHSLAPGESRRFEGWLQVVPEGDLAPVVAREIDRRQQPGGEVHGTLSDDQGKAPPSGLLMIEKQGAPYAWTLAKDGTFSTRLPAGEYRVYATAEGFANTEPVNLRVTKDSRRELTFDNMRGPGTLALTVKDAESGAPRDARLTLVEGQKPPVEFLGKNTAFTRLQPAGQAELELAPGDYRLAINAGAGFTARSQTLDVSLDTGKRRAETVEVERLAAPNDRHWYGADLHHHADVLEGTTPPEMVVRSQLATDLDLTFVSDHDSTANHQTFAELSAARGVPFIPSIEISPSWGHLNPFPIAISGELQVDPGTDSVQAIVADARRLGAEVVPMNHPYNSYGYLRNLGEGKVSGGFMPGFDLMEFNATVDNAPTLAAAHRLWDQGIGVYFTAGTDTHDVWNALSGRMRMMAQVPGKLTPDAFARALKDGHGYATQGPLLYPRDHGFGDSLRLEKGAEASWNLDVTAVDGLKEARLIGKGSRVLATRALKGTDATLALTIPAEAKGWVALEVEDADGDTAWSNPLWLDRVDKAAYLENEDNAKS